MSTDMASIQKLLEQMKASGGMPGLGGDEVPDLVGDFESAAKEPAAKDEVSKVD